MKLTSPVALLAVGTVGAVLALEAWQPNGQSAGQLAQPANRSQGDDPRAAVLTAPLGIRLNRERLSGDVIGEPFGARESPRPVSAAPPPPVPVAAPFPYRYAGQLSFGDGNRRVYLAKGNDLTLVNVGDVLDGVFKVTAIADDGLEILHIPTAIATQMLFSAMSTEMASASPDAVQGRRSAGAGVGASDHTSVPGSAAPGGSSVSGANYAGAPIAGFGGGIPGAVAPIPPSAPSTAGPSAVTSGSVPSGRLGSPGPTAGAAPLGVAPSGAGSMPMLAAPVGVMRTLPPPTGKLGI